MAKKKNPMLWIIGIGLLLVVGSQMMSTAPVEQEPFPGTAADPVTGEPAVVKQVTSTTLFFRLMDDTTSDSSGYNQGTFYLYDSNGGLITSVAVVSGGTYGNATVDYGESGTFSMVGGGTLGTDRATGMKGTWTADKSNKYYTLTSKKLGTVSPKVKWEGTDYSDWNHASTNCTLTNSSAGAITGLCQASEDGGVAVPNNGSETTDSTETIAMANGETMTGINVWWKEDTADSIFGNTEHGGLLVVIDYPTATYEDWQVKSSSGQELEEVSVPSLLSDFEKAWIWPVGLSDYTSDYFNPIYSAKAEPTTATVGINITVLDYETYLTEDGETVSIGVEDDNDANIGAATDSVVILHS